MSDVLARWEGLAARLHAELEAVGGGPRPFGTVVDRIVDPTTVEIDGQPVLMLGANNYLGLSGHPAVVGAAREALGCTGTTGSRVANGTTAAHVALERQLARAFGRRHAMIFTTGHQANLSVIGSAAGPDDAVVLDEEAHASLVDGARLTGARIFLFRHNDPRDLAKKLRAASPRPTLVVVEGLYSIRGDVAPLAALAAECRAAGARLVVDEAHSFGVYGPSGLGVAAQAGLGDEVDVITGTFSKSLGGVGGFAVSDHPGFPALHLAARAYLFTASSPPAQIAAASAALAILTDPREGPRLREALWANVHALRETLGPLAVGEASPIVSVPLGDGPRAVAAWRGALARGVYVNLVLPPGCRRGQERLRISVSAAHDPEQIERAGRALVAAVEGACRASS